MILLNFNLHCALLFCITASMQHVTDFIKKFLLFMDRRRRRSRNIMNYEPVKFGFLFWLKAATASIRSLEGIAAVLKTALNIRFSFT
jgi:hypothetical protein